MKKILIATILLVSGIMASCTKEITVKISPVTTFRNLFSAKSDLATAD